MSRAPAWTPAECDELLRLRDVERKPWAQVYAAMPQRSPKAIQFVYYSKLRSRNASGSLPYRRGRPRGARRELPAPLPPEDKQARLAVIRAASLAFARRQEKPPPAAPVIVARGEPVRSSAAVSTSRLVVDAELRSRIAVLGITGGLLGDPEPGRSALDKRKAGL